MKHFSSISISSIVTFSVNFGEYSGTKFYPSTFRADTDKEIIDFALQRLAVCFETPFNQVYSAFASICSLGEDAYTSLCPSEESVLRDLYDFWKTYIIDQNSEKSECTVFNYTNLNTGAQLHWTYVVL